MKSKPKQECLDDLRLRILTLAIAPGSDLDETALSATYGVSRTPLREVLQRLAGEGYVQLAENRCAKVVSMDLAAMRAFFRTAPLIYASAARLAAENRTAAQLDALKAVQARFASAATARDAEAMALANHRFHALVGEMAANDSLMPSLNRLLIDHTRLAQMFYRPASAAEAMAVTEASHQHDAMIAAIAAGDAETAAALTLSHWDLSRDRIERFVRPDPLPHDIIELAEGRNAV